MSVKRNTATLFESQSQFYLCTYLKSSHWEELLLDLDKAFLCNEPFLKCLSWLDLSSVPGVFLYVACPSSKFFSAA